MFKKEGVGTSEIYATEAGKTGARSRQIGFEKFTEGQDCFEKSFVGRRQSLPRASGGAITTVVEEDDVGQT